MTYFKHKSLARLNFVTGAYLTNLNFQAFCFRFLHLARHFVVTIWYTGELIRELIQYLDIMTFRAKSSEREENAWMLGCSSQ